jgi:hypothetical protein
MHTRLLDCPNNHPPINSTGCGLLATHLNRQSVLTAKLADSATRIFIDPHGVDRVLMDRLELRVNLSLTLEIHLTEHIKSRLFAGAACSRALLVLDGPCELPCTLISTEFDRFTVLGSHQLNEHTQ